MDTLYTISWVDPHRSYYAIANNSDCLYEIFFMLRENKNIDNKYIRVIETRNGCPVDPELGLKIDVKQIKKNCTCNDEE